MAKAEQPLVRLGQGDYAREYHPCPRHEAPSALLQRNLATFLARASSLFGRAGYVGHAFQHYGPASAQREIQEVGKLLDQVREAMDVVSEQLDQETNK